MAMTAPAMLDPPAGWEPNGFWNDLSLDLEAHRSSLLVAAAMLSLLLLGRSLLASSDRRHLRISLAFLLLFFILLPIRALVLYVGDAGHYRTFLLISTVMLAWGTIGVGGLLIFDLIGKRLGIAKILRDLTITICSIVALMIILSRSGVNLLSIITTSAVVTAVIGLALQDTLGNLLSGIALQLESSFTIGDWIRVDKDGQIGKVREVRWRSTVIETRNGDLIVIPNGLITKNLITNFAKDGLENRRWVYFNVHLRHPPNQVIKTVTDAIKGVANVSEQTPPDCVLMSFEESWAKYAVRYRLIDFRPDDPTDSAVRTRIWYALHRANIEIPYPGYNVFTTALDAGRDQRKAERERRVRIDALARVGFLQPLDEKERQHLADGMRHEVFGPGEVIIRMGEPGDSLYLIRSGEVIVKIGVNGLEREVATLSTGQFFGEMSLFTGEPRHATVVAKGDAECYVVDRNLFHDVLERKQSLVAQIGKLLHDRELELKGEQEGLSAEAARRSAHEEALLGRIKSFFGLA
jgi:small-conductance mechanosensitive channel/CRP-like cAMP-binding protein